MSTQLEIDSGSSYSSDEAESSNDVVIYRHTAEVRLDMDNEEVAQIVLKALEVDKEPKRSGAVRHLSQDGKFLILKVQSKDRKSLQKSISNTIDMCELSRSAVSLAFSKPGIGSKRPYKP
ncbi:unnamed protein product [Caenorhabditis auriculariae]|uniref:L antigen family member 3 n=1 Tax=Caenorhabditis auriculariae TaxID=2777116 RepID=A0A8S1GQH4_9PELO|nr:unnamed protein product [Caenorhabditis auriculariae]